MSFEITRVKINHNALKNDIFCRLTYDISLLSNRNNPQRIKLLSKLLNEIEEPTENIWRAVNNWKNGNPRWELDGNIPTCITDLVEQAKNFGPFEIIAENFPSDKTILEWIVTIENTLLNLDKLPPKGTPERIDQIKKFWESATALHDFLHDISIKSPTFWTYFKKRES